MSFGTLYHKDGTRGGGAAALATYYKLNIKVSGPDDNFAEQFPLQKFPSFIGTDGVKIHQVIAVLFYFASIIKEKHQVNLLGNSLLEQAHVLQWASLANTDFCDKIIPAFVTAIPAIPQNYPVDHVKDCLKQADKIVALYEERINDHDYLVGDSLTIADILSVQIMAYPFMTTWDKEFREKHPKLTSYFQRIIGNEILQSNSFFKNFNFVEKNPFA